MNKKEKKIILETSRLILREYTLDDFDELYKLLSDPITMKHYLKPYDEKEAIFYIRVCYGTDGRICILYKRRF